MKWMKPTFLFAVASLLVLSSSAAAQSNNDLRRENERLRAEVRALTQELEAARQRIAELEGELADRDRPGTRPVQDPLDDAPTTRTGEPDRGPAHNPAALLRQLQEEYTEAMNEQPPGRVGSRERESYYRALNRWYLDVNRRRHAVVWAVRIVDVAPSNRGSVNARVQVVQHDDPAIGYGDPFDLAISRSTAHRLMQMRDRAEEDRPEAYILRGQLSPQLRFNEDRYEPGPFNRPRFVGLFTEFEFTVDVRLLLPLEEADRILREQLKQSYESEVSDEAEPGDDSRDIEEP